MRQHHGRISRQEVPGPRTVSDDIEIMIPSPGMDPTFEDDRADRGPGSLDETAGRPRPAVRQLATVGAAFGLPERQPTAGHKHFGTHRPAQGVPQPGCVRIHAAEQRRRQGGGPSSPERRAAGGFDGAAEFLRQACTDAAADDHDGLRAGFERGQRGAPESPDATAPLRPQHGPEAAAFLQGSQYVPRIDAVSQTGGAHQRHDVHLIPSGATARVGRLDQLVGRRAPLVPRRFEILHDRRR